MDISTLTHRPTKKGMKKEFGQFGKYNTPREYGIKNPTNTDESYKEDKYNSFSLDLSSIFGLIGNWVDIHYKQDQDTRRKELLKKKVGAIKLILGQIDKLYKPKHKTKKKKQTN